MGKICLILVLAIVGTKVSGSRYGYGYYRNGAPAANNPEPSPAPAALTSPTPPTDAGFRGYYGRGSYYRNGHYGYNNTEPWCKPPWCHNGVNTEPAPEDDGSEEKPQEGGNGWGCCNRCWDWRCKHSPCCHKKKESESSPSEPAPAPAPAPSPAPAPALLTALPQEGEDA